MCLNMASERPKDYSKLFIQKKEKINDMKFKNYIKNRDKKIQEEIKDIIIDKYREKIISQSKEIEKLKKKLGEIMKTSVYILKNSFTNINIDSISNIINNMNNTISQKSKLKNDILNIKNKKDIVVRSIINRNKNSNFNGSTTFSNGNNKLKKSNTFGNGLAVEHKKIRVKIIYHYQIVEKN